MKLRCIIYSVLVIFVLGIVGCSSKQKLTEAENSKEVESIPCAGYKSDNQYFRSNQSGESPQMSFAKKQALLNAKTELAGNIQSRIKSVTQQYTNQKTFQSEEAKKEFEQEMEELTRDVVDQELSNVNVICEKVHNNEEENTYQYFVAIEKPTEELLEGLTNEQKMQLEYDKQKFEQIYNEEMKKLKEEREDSMQ